MASPMKVQGRCHCGAIGLSAEVQLDTVIICHCTDCQRMSGSAFRAVVPALAGSLSVTGPIKSYKKTADSGAIRLQCFCPECGTSMYSRGESSEALATLRVGMLDQRSQLRPRAQIWQSSELPWVQALAEVPGCQHQELLN